ncbi:hypothetical protein OE88DRAFT_1725800 [Heliocybe sulcata]|uniref:Uncharacterized protein n=1 Tax=Heliocybe sulcata TaxID=5364 RepID=A0A5C3N1V8_9AGAM|nr:hypothetical protein OE88DRAFT_1725800 [Heliocybe sulcata]
MEFDMILLAWVLAFPLISVALLGLAVLFWPSIVAVFGLVSGFAASLWTRIAAVRGSAGDGSIVTWWNRNSVASAVLDARVTSMSSRPSVEGDRLLGRIKQSALNLLPAITDPLVTSSSSNDSPLPIATNPEVITVAASPIPQQRSLDVYWLPRLIGAFHNHVSHSSADGAAYDTVEPGSPATADVESQESDLWTYDSITASTGAGLLFSDSSSSVFSPAGSELPTLVSQWTAPTAPTSRATVANSDYRASLRTSRRWSYPLSQPEVQSRTAVINSEYQASLKTSRRTSLPIGKRTPESQHGRSFSMPVSDYSPTVDWTKRKTAEETKKDLLVALGLELPSSPVVQPKDFLTPSASSPASFTPSATVNIPPTTSETPVIESPVEDVSVFLEGSSLATVASEAGKSFSTSTSSGSSTAFDTSDSSLASSSSVTSCSSGDECSVDTIGVLPTPTAILEAPVEKLKSKDVKGKKPAPPSDAKVWSPSASWRVRTPVVKKDLKTVVKARVKTPAVVPATATKVVKASQPGDLVKQPAVVAATATKVVKASQPGKKEVKPTPSTKAVKASKMQADVSVKAATTPMKSLDASKPSKTPVAERKEVLVPARRNSTAKAAGGTWR